MNSPKRRSPRTPPQHPRANHQKQPGQFTSNPLDMVLSRLDRVKPTGPCTWLASCPTTNHSHGDRSRGLSIREGDSGQVLLHCFAGCAIGEVVAALGLTLAELFPTTTVEYPDYPPRTRPRPAPIPRRDLLEAIQRDLRVCALAFADLASGKAFAPADAATLARLSASLSDTVREVLS